jgi:ABC-2 type transport system permease protein
MSLSNIIRKEVKELLTISAIIPVVVMAIVFGSMGSMNGDIQEQIEKKPTIGVIDEDDGVLATIGCQVLEANANILYNGTDVQEGLRMVKDGGGDALLVITPGFTEDIMDNRSGMMDAYWIMRGTGTLDSISSASVEALIQTMGKSISAVMIDHGSSLNASIVLNPTNITQTTFVKDKELDGITPGTISGIMSSQNFIMPLLIMLIIMMSGGTIISSMALEKENKTLETLLTLPVKRGSIVTGKIVGSALVGLVFAGIYMVGFAFYMESFQVTSQVDLASYGLTLSPLDYLLLGTSMFVTILAALALCILLGAFAKNYKSTQTLTMPIILLALIPYFVTMLKNFDTLPAALQVGLFAIPFSHPMTAMNNLMFDEYWLVIAGIIYTALFAVVCILLAVRVFNSDILLTGFKKKTSKNPRGKIWERLRR